ncbi:MAG: fibrobacter succinogenes major paralogous domain-containing protein [Bacteroidota bacterium]|jgi:uncharacterized protein (TIGR02145 family)
MTKLLLIALVLFCTTPPVMAQKDSVSKKKIYKTWVKLTNGQGTKKGVIYEIRDSSVLISDSREKKDYYKGNFRTSKIDVSSIDKIKIRRVRRTENGALIGTLTGLAAGIIVGGLLTSASGNTTAGGYVLFGIWGAGAGAIIGAGLGSMKICIPIHGKQASYNSNMKKLKSYAIMNQNIPAKQVHFTRLHDNIADTDRNIYHTLAISGQVWMEGNLKVTHYRNGDLIPVLNNKESWANTASAASCHYGNDSTRIKTEDKLYNLDAVNDRRGICPKGWHVPTYGEWSSLVHCLGEGSEAGKKLTDPIPAVSGSRSDEPFALPGCFRFPGGDYSSERGRSYQWWSSTPVDSLTGKAFYMGNADGGIIFTNTDKHAGLPVKCLRDN